MFYGQLAGVVGCLGGGAMSMVCYAKCWGEICGKGWSSGSQWRRG